jgi:hypothetical protein
MRPKLRQSAPKPTAPAWWTLPLTREQFTARAAAEAERMNAVTTNYERPAKSRDE